MEIAKLSSLGNWKLLLGDVFLVLILGVCQLLLQNVMPIYQSGLFPDDQSISKPLKTETVPMNWLLWFLVVVPLLFLLVCDLLMRRTGRVLPFFFQETLHLLVIFSFGFVVVYIFTEVVKKLDGRLRPDFLSRCAPVFPASISPHAYLANEHLMLYCTGDRQLIENGRTSFFSGHCSLSFYVAAFCILYIQYFFPSSISSFSTLFRPLLQFAFFLAASCVAVTRYVDNRHHTDDIMFGSLVGLCGSVFAFKLALIPPVYSLSDPVASSADTLSDPLLPPAPRIEDGHPSSALL